MSVVSVYAIFANDDEAVAIGRRMVEERLAACVNILGPVRSIYRWQGKVEDAAEVAALFKTSHETVDQLMVRIAALHSHDVPCIVSTPIDKVLRGYAAWVEDSTT